MTRVATARWRRAARYVRGCRRRALRARLRAGPRLADLVPDFRGRLSFCSTAATRATRRSRRDWKCAALIGFWFGFGFFFAGLYWIAEAFLVEPWRHAWLLPFVMTAMPGGMALFFAAACALAIAMWLPGVGRIFALAIAFGLAEFARGHVLTGLPWNLLGYALLGTLPFMQLAALFGVYALSLIAVLLFASPVSFFAPAGSGLAGRWPTSCTCRC